MSTADNHLQDWLGSEITVGAMILHSGYKGSSQWVTLSEVIEIGHKSDPWRGGIDTWYIRAKPIKSTGFRHASSRAVTITALERVTVLKECANDAAEHGQESRDSVHSS